MEQLQYQEGRTEIGQLGKVRLIDRLTADTDCTGDDCAVLGEGREKTLVTVQTMVEGVDFDMMYTPLKHLGYKAVAIAISNIAAMNGTPRQALVSLAVSNRYSVEALDELYAGVRLCCDRYDVDLVGGETGTSRAGMVLTVTAVGEALADIGHRRGHHALLRQGLDDVHAGLGLEEAFQHIVEAVQVGLEVGVGLVGDLLPLEHQQAGVGAAQVAADADEVVVLGTVAVGDAVLVGGAY